MKRKLTLIAPEPLKSITNTNKPVESYLECKKVNLKDNKLLVEKEEEITDDKKELLEKKLDHTCKLWLKKHNTEIDKNVSNIVILNGQEETHCYMSRVKKLLEDLDKSMKIENLPKWVALTKSNPKDVATKSIVEMKETSVNRAINTDHIDQKLGPGLETSIEVEQETHKNIGGIINENNDINIEKRPGHKKRLETENVPIGLEELDNKTKTNKNSDNQGKKIIIKDVIVIAENFKKNEKEFWIKLVLHHRSPLSQVMLLKSARLEIITELVKKE
ncbi:622_t:CDS:2 [Gigaspora margarita]|uniref:622_t:CDS:1 n=1 Tax=Gigaspora margarita TaxID=4874 RepID=A0ABN7V3V7_GIGMA|nr:622_t:CDS:2 [Gigaspora margarita]